MATGKPRKGIGSGGGTSANRTSGGNVSASARAKTGSGPDKKYPMPDHQAALNAVKLRHNSNSVSAGQVLDKASRYAQQHNDAKVKKAVADARAVDRKRGGK